MYDHFVMGSCKPPFRFGANVLSTDNSYSPAIPAIYETVSIGGDFHSFGALSERQEIHIKTAEGAKRVAKFPFSQTSPLYSY